MAEPTRLPTVYWPGPGGAAAAQSADSSSDDEGDPVGHEKKRATRRMVFKVAIGAAIALILVLAYRMFSPRTLAQSLARCGWTLYTMTGCGHCERQLKLLPGFSAVTECSGGKVVSSSGPVPVLACKGVAGFPTWYNTRTKEKRAGFQDVKELHAMTEW